MRYFALVKKFHYTTSALSRSLQRGRGRALECLLTNVLISNNSCDKPEQDCVAYCASQVAMMTQTVKWAGCVAVRAP